MKKQKYYKAIRAENKMINFEEAQGYVIDVTTKYGYTVKVALEYERPYWKATHYDSGALIVSYINKCKTQEQAIERIKILDFEKYFAGNNGVKNLERQLADFKKLTGV